VKTLVLGNKDKAKHGPVHDAQYLLAEGRFGNFHPGPRDGIFGDQMAAAIKRAKWQLGYPSSAIVPVFGTRLYHYLLLKERGGWVLPPAFLVRRAARRPKPTSKRDLVCDYARWGVRNEGQIGYAQVRPMPSTPWSLPMHTDCSGFSTMAYKAAKAPDPNHLGYNGSGNTDTLLAHGTPVSIAQLRPADLVFYDHPDHVGIYIGNGFVIEHGSSRGPRWEPTGYRTVTHCRRYL